MAVVNCSHQRKLINNLRFMSIIPLMFLGCKDFHASSAEIVGLNPSKPGEFSLQVVKFVDIPSLPHLLSEKMRFVTKARLRQGSISEEAQKSQSFADLLDALQNKIDGKPLNLNLSIENEIARGQTFESMLALSAYCHLEKIFFFAKEKAKVGDDLFNRPLTVAVYGEILSDDRKAPTVSKSDNAIYVGSADTVFLLPLGKEEGLPLAMHEGVLAHEFHHRIFFKKIWDNPDYPNLWSLFQSRYDPFNIRLEMRSRILLNALDEGLADIFAIAFTGLPDYLDVSLTHKNTEALRRQRDINGDFAREITYDFLRETKTKNDLLEACGEKAEDFTSPKFNVYCLGTIIARTIFLASSENLQILRELVLPVVVESLSKIAAKLDRGHQFELDIFFDELVVQSQKVSSEFSTNLCRQLRERFASLATPERIPSCRDFWKSL
jgi:hypothetical protein